MNTEILGSQIRILSLSLSFSLSLFASTVFCAESDNFTSREKNYPDYTLFINNFVNAKLLEIVKESNANNKEAKYKKCNQVEFMELVEYSLDTNFTDLDYEIDEKLGKDVGQENTIYKKSAIGGCCSPILQIGKVKMGADKISHMLGNGFMLFAAAEKPNKAKTAGLVSRNQLALDEALLQEHGGWGLDGTGVKSYGDLAADYAGYRFYSQLFAAKDPYITCSKGVFRQVRPFNISDYADDSWDESINCSSYATRETWEKVRRNIRKASGGKRCPVDPASCKALKAKYGDQLSKVILSPNCRDISREFVLVEKGAGVTTETAQDLVEEGPALLWHVIKKTAAGIFE